MTLRTKGFLVGGLAFCAMFSAGAAVGSVRGEQAAQVVSYDGAEAEYILRDYGGYVSVFEPGLDSMPLQVTAIEVSALRQTDHDMLRGGVSVGSREQLLLLLEDLGS